MRVLITGATGFIGQHLLEMIDYTSFQVSILTRDIYKKHRINNKEVKILKGDLNDFSSLLLATKNIDCVINIAAEVRNESFLAQTNIQGVENLMKACLENNIQKFIQISSVGVVGKQYNLNYELVDENCEPTPKNQYEITKLESEKIIIKRAKNTSLITVILRPTNVYGEYHPYNALLSISIFLKKYKLFFTTRNARVNFVYVKDVCTVILHCLENKNFDGEIVNVGSSIKYDEFTKSITKSLGVKIKVIYLPMFFVLFLEKIGLRKLRPISNGIEYDSTKFRKIIFKFEKEGIVNTVSYFRINKLIQ